MARLHKELFLYLITFTLLSSFSYVASCGFAVNAWIEPGYYFSHRCQITFEVISQYFQTRYQIFHLLSANQNSYFLNKVDDYFNPTYAKANDSIQEIFKSSPENCIFKNDLNYYCAYIVARPVYPHYSNYRTKFNSTHNSMTFRVERGLCPAQDQKLQFQVKIPARGDYDKYYVVSYSWGDDISFSQQDKLSFEFDQSVNVDLSNLTYKPLSNIIFPESVYFLKGCKLEYKIKVRFDNVSYYDSWDRIDIFVSNPQNAIDISGQCRSSLLKSHSCEKSSSGYTLYNHNKTILNKSYDIEDVEFYQYAPIEFEINFAMQFLRVSSSVKIELKCISQNQNIQQSQLKINHKTSEVYGRSVIQIQGYQQAQFNKIKQHSLKYDPLKCILPESNSNSNSSNSNSQNSQNGQPYTFNKGESNVWKLARISFMLSTFFLIVLTFLTRKSAILIQKLLYLISILILSTLKIAYLIIGFNSSLIQNEELKQSVLFKGQEYFQLFIMKVTFTLQFFLNAFYFLLYVILILLSADIMERIKSMYGRKREKTQQQANDQNFNPAQEKSKYSCTLAVFIYVSCTVIGFLLSFKLYAVLIYKLHLDTEDEKYFRTHRFKNVVLYRMHQGHLILDLIMQINVFIWLHLLIGKQQTVTGISIFLYIMLFVYAIHIYSIGLVLKEIHGMSTRSEQINTTEDEKVRKRLTQIQTEEP